MKLSLRILCLLALLYVPLFSAHLASADDRSDALAWLARYRKTQVLFHDKDLQRVEEKLKIATPQQSQQWLEQTAEIRQALDSPRWKGTRRWLKEFLQVQAIYSDADLDKFRDEARVAAKDSPKGFIDLLVDIDNKRTRLVKSAANSQAVRKRQLEINEHYRQEAVKQRHASRSRPANTAPQPVQVINKQSQTRPPLVNSMDAARWSVMRNFVPRW